MTKYKVTIERERIEYVARKQYTVVGHDEKGGEVMGYTPETELPTIVREDIYVQVVDELDVPAVIRAVLATAGGVSSLMPPEPLSRETKRVVFSTHRRLKRKLL